MLAIFQIPPTSTSNIQSLKVIEPCTSVSRAHATFPADSIESIVRRTASEQAAEFFYRQTDQPTIADPASIWFRELMLALTVAMAGDSPAGQ